MRRALARLLVLATVAGGGTFLVATAEASPTHCSSRVTNYGTGGAAICARRTGFYRVTITCTPASGRVYFREGPWLKPGQGESKANCNRPDRVTYHAVQKRN
ncbi:hypothetical protein NLX83_19190 [Allokutzneria sp. A3M-2-11 16]|uniref:hypothetical protein n=1 Tax=Allokutzneria sp. A3M-2-11 16 TaxID=2962043 RepID=UPI0020B8A7B0|nr:hypothetical protein [Allokutzneria sp. A3M-2-11 16]MCP3801386.1 hypothetical protein [Allokutzneria sp. A3M-2-11 16]